MMQLLLFCICTSLAITAIHTVVTRPGMLLNWVSNMGDKFLFDSITKPLYGCMICMSSIWTIVFAFVFNPPSGAWGPAFNPPSGVWGPGPGLLFAILIVAGINTIICALLDKLTDYGC